MKKVILISVLIAPLIIWFTCTLMATILELLCEQIMELADKIESKIKHK